MTSPPADGGHRQAPTPLTKTRLRCGEIALDRSHARRRAREIESLSSAHGEIEDLLCDLSGEDFTDLESPEHPTTSDPQR